MKLRKLIKRAEEVLSTKKSQQLAKKADLETLLVKLRKKEKSLTEELRLETDKEKKQKLKNKIALAHSQRKKGLTALADLKKTA